MPITITGPDEGTFVMTMSNYAEHPSMGIWLRLPGGPPSLDWQDDQYDSDKLTINVTA